MKYHFYIFLLLINSVSFCQYKNIKVNKTNNLPEEVCISINPLNPLNLIAGSNIDNYYYSFDGGLTWENGVIKSKDYGIWGDPCLIFDAQGNAYYFHLSRPSWKQWLDRIVCQKSTDGGISWSNPGSYMGMNPPKEQDKEWACADPFKAGYVYTLWTQFDAYESKNPLDSSNIMFSFSSDGGESWSEAIRINEHAGDCLDSSNTVEGAVPCAGLNGEIYVSWSGPLGIVFDKSTDGGISWLDKDIPVCEQIGGWCYDIEGIYRCNGMPVTACDISSSPFRGTIYINFSDIGNGVDDVDIFLIKSTDGGNSWSKIKRVNDDPFKNNKQQFMCWMSVDPISGAVNIIFYDRRNYDNTLTDVYLARSTDGGETFTNIKISESPFKPDKSVFFGDYIGVASYNDFTACIWQRLDGRVLSVQYCGIDFKK
jgi:hypothetical protein